MFVPRYKKGDTAARKAMFSNYTTLKPAERYGRAYVGIFAGATDEDAIKLKHADPSVGGFLPVWKGLLAKGEADVQDCPFIWKYDGVEYTSSCVAFEKNIILANAVIGHWNTLNRTPKNSPDLRLKEGVAILHHLIQSNGLDEDETRPADERLLPEIVRRDYLKNLQKGMFSLALAKEADEIVPHSPTDHHAIANLRGYATKEESSLLTKGWYNKQRALAHSAEAQALLDETENGMPDAEKCVRSYCLFNKAIRTPGCPHKNLYEAKKGVCVGDMKVVYKLSQSKIDSLSRGIGTNIELVFDVPPVPAWLNTPPDIMELSSKIIKIA